MLRAGIVGLGVGEQHIEGYRAHPYCVVSVLCDFDEQKRMDVGRRYPDIPVVKQARDVINDPQIDVVSIASYDDHHYQQIMHAVGAGKHVFVEKPLVSTPEQARDIRSLLNRNPNVRLSSNLILRKSPRFELLKKMISDGELGNLYYVEGDYNYGRLHKLLAGWRSEMNAYSMVYGGGVHIIDLMHWLTGDRIVEVDAAGNRLATHGGPDKNFDMVVALLRFQSGVVGKMSANGSCVYPHFHRLSVYGTAATFENGLDGGMLFQTRDPAVSPRSIDAPYPGARKGDLIKGFVDAILNAQEPEVTVEDVFESLSVCFAIEQSAHEAKPMRVEYI